MTEADALIAFVTARLDEREAVARAATAGPWVAVGSGRSDDTDGFYQYAIDAGEGTSCRFNPHSEEIEAVPCRISVAGPGYEGGGVTKREDAEHIALNDPAYVLADIAAKRTILVRFQGALLEQQAHPGDVGNNGYVVAMSQVAADMALPFAQHPDYRDAWRPA